MTWRSRIAYARANPRAALAACAARLSRAAGSIASAILARLLRQPLFADAVWRALTQDRRWTPARNLAVGAEIMRRCRAIPDPNGANRYLPHRWRRIFVGLRERTRTDVDWRAGPVFLNFGAGDRNPMALPLLAVLAGASRAIALEPGPVRADVATVTLQETLWDVVRDPAAYGLVGANLGRLRDALDADALARGDPIEKILATGRLEFSRATGEAAGFADGSIDLVYSRSVLEHVTSIEAAMARLVAALKPGGVMLHDIALDSHDLRDPVAFYYTEQPVEPGSLAGLNGWRLSDYVALFERLGCTVEIARTETLPPGSVDRARLLPRFATRTDSDLSTIRAELLVRKPKSPPS
jgi:SAM-dependent methyltransferase